MSHRIRGLVVFQVELDVEGERWLPSRMAQELQDMVVDPRSSVVTRSEKTILHMSFDNNDLEQERTNDMATRLQAALRGDENP